MSSRRRRRPGCHGHGRSDLLRLLAWKRRRFVGFSGKEEHGGTGEPFVGGGAWASLSGRQTRGGLGWERDPRDAAWMDGMKQDGTWIDGMDGVMEEEARLHELVLVCERIDGKKPHLISRWNNDPFDFSAEVIMIRAKFPKKREDSLK